MDMIQQDVVLSHLSLFPKQIVKPGMSSQGLFHTMATDGAQNFKDSQRLPSLSLIVSTNEMAPCTCMQRYYSLCLNLNPSLLGVAHGGGLLG